MVRLRSERRVIVCVECGKDFRTSQKWTKYCSPQCGKEHYRREHNYKVLPEKACLNCKVAFKPYNGRNAFCSIACRIEYRQKVKGIELTKVDWVDMREFVLERDDFTCQDCGTFAMGGLGLVAHHVVPLYSHGDNSIGNLTILCVECHLKAHSLEIDYES